MIIIRYILNFTKKLSNWEWTWFQDKLTFKFGQNITLPYLSKIKFDKPLEAKWKLTVREELCLLAVWSLKHIEKEFADNFGLEANFYILCGYDKNVIYK